MLEAVVALPVLLVFLGANVYAYNAARGKLTAQAAARERITIVASKGCDNGGSTDLNADDYYDKSDLETEVNGVDLNQGVFQRMLNGALRIGSEGDQRTASYSANLPGFPQNYSSTKQSVSYMMCNEGGGLTDFIEGIADSILGALPF